MQQPTVGRCSWWAPWAAGATRQPTYKRPSRPSVRSALTAFNLYRSTTDTVALTAANKLNTSVLTTASYTDRTAANGTTYTYVLTAVDKALPAHDILVAADGTGPYTSVQAAVNAALAGTSTKRTDVDRCGAVVAGRLCQARSRRGRAKCLSWL